MKAIVYNEYGPPDVLHVEEVEKPTPKDNEVLVQVKAAAPNPADWHLMRGKPLIARLDFGLRKPKYSILGLDVAGQVEAVGANVTRLKPGDEVFGEVSAGGYGGFAEYVCAPEDGFVLKPANISFEAAAAVPVAAITALQGMRDSGQLQAGQKVLINGASGGVGTFAVQIAKHYGAEVTGVCSTRNLDLVRSIGADHVIDYTQQDFTRDGPGYDLIFCAVGNRSAFAYRRALSPQGKCVIAGFTTMPHLIFQVSLLGFLITKTSSKSIGGMGVAQPNQKDLEILRELLETEKIVPVIDKRYPLNETAEAIRYLETMRARGKVIITMEDDA